MIQASFATVREEFFLCSKRHGEAGVNFHFWNLSGRCVENGLGLIEEVGRTARNLLQASTLGTTVTGTAQWHWKWRDTALFRYILEVKPTGLVMDGHGIQGRDRNKDGFQVSDSNRCTYPHFTEQVRSSGCTTLCSSPFELTCTFFLFSPNEENLSPYSIPTFSCQFRIAPPSCLLYCVAQSLILIPSQIYKFSSLTHTTNSSFICSDQKPFSQFQLFLELLPQFQKGRQKTGFGSTGIAI